MKFSIITVARNAAETIQDTIISVLSQDYPDVEYIIIDGASTDGTLDMVNKFKDRIDIVVSEPDNGLYDAMNKGVSRSSGDIIAFLNADDVYANAGVISSMARVFADPILDVCYGDLVYVKDDMETIVRYYQSNKFTPEKIPYGWMPAHPTMFVRRRLFYRYGQFKTDYRIAADFEFVARIFRDGTLCYKYIPGVSVKMRMGGVSTKSIKSNLILNTEIVRACRENGIRTNYAMVGIKYVSKIMQLFLRPH